MAEMSRRRLFGLMAGAAAAPVVKAAAPLTFQGVPIEFDASVSYEWPASAGSFIAAPQTMLVSDEFRKAWLGARARMAHRMFHGPTAGAAALKDLTGDHHG